jgi:hypothetical protein
VTFTATEQLPGWGQRPTTCPALLDPADLHDRLTTARRAGVVVLDADHPGTLAQLQGLLDRRLVLTPVPGAPGWATADTGPTVTAPPGPWPAADAVRTAAKVTGAAIATHPAVAHAAAAATTPPSQAPGLRPWQRALVAAYLAAGPGLVNALPPGTGKTVCAAAALASRAELAGPPHKAVVLAPASTRAQWAAELARHHPAAAVHVLTSATHTRELATGEARPQVAVLAPELLPRVLDELLPWAAVDLIVDEATFLASAHSARTRASWALRRTVPHAMLLTGTPNPRGLGTLQALVEFARNDTGLFTAHPLTGDHPLVPDPWDRLGPFVHTGGAKAAAAVPGTRTSLVRLTPGPAEEQLHGQHTARLTGLLAGVRTATATVRLRSELETWRRSLTAPTHPAAPGAKITWAADRLTAVPGAGALVFSDSTTALEALSAELQRRGYPHATLTSKVPAPARTNAVADFQDGRLSALLVSGTGQLGLNLHRATLVIHLDLPWTPAMFTQRTARAARLGNTTSTVTVEVPVLTGTGEHHLARQLLEGSLPTDPWRAAELVLSA